MKLRLPAAPALIALLVGLIPSPGLAQTDETFALDPLLQAVGDLDGDGTRDLVRVSGRSSEATDFEGPPNQLTAFKGTTGAVLWSVDVPSWATQARAAQVGPGATQGVILNGYLFSRTTVFTGGAGYETPYGGGFLSGAANLLTGVTAVSGSGTVLWTRTFDERTFVYVPGTSKAYVDGLALFSGLLDGGGSTPDDVLISVYDREPSADGQEDTLQGFVLDGADGSTASTGTVDVDSTVTSVLPAGDLNGDGQGDYTVQLHPYTSENQRSFIALDGASGQRLWTLPLPDEDSVQQTRLGDVTGDGSNDLAFTVRYSTPNLPDDDVLVVNGRTGAIESAFVADIVRSAPDLSGDGVRDILVGYREQNADTAAVTYELYRSDGLILRYRPYGIPRDGSEDSVTGQIRSSVGDIDGDGVDDLAHTLSTDGGENDSRVVSGRDGSTIRTGSVDGPLFASVDGHGDDLAELTTVSQRSRDVAVSDGLTEELLWTVRLQPRGEITGSFELEAADLTGDGRAEVITKAFSTTPGTQLPDGTDVENQSFRDIWVLDGRDGSVLWTLT